MNSCILAALPRKVAGLLRPSDRVAFPKIQGLLLCIEHLKGSVGALYELGLFFSGVAVIAHERPRARRGDPSCEFMGNLGSIFEGGSIVAPRPVRIVADKTDGFRQASPGDWEIRA